ncbi:MAG TPA: N-acetylmuramoyl-L-alanine amidase [Patescibacteria group bacterium]|nr:N-acetylmuramoyl-L-alanine amidase [Patescibacteria group bacterium]
MNKKICLDPGHPSYFNDGKVNYGAVSKDEIREVEINLRVAEFLKQKLEEEGYQVVMTREDNDEVIDNIKRVKIAKDNEADFIFRIHCDQTKDGNPTIRGIRTFFPPPMAESISEKSLEIAKIVHGTIVKELDLKDGGIVDETKANIDPKLGMLLGTKEANKYGIPTILVEMVYLSNPKDAQWIKNTQNQQKIARWMAKGISAAIQKGII